MTCPGVPDGLGASRARGPILVTGAGGFGGRHLIAALVAAGGRALGASQIVAGLHDDGERPRTPAAGWDPCAPGSVRLADLDVRDPAQVEALIRSIRPAEVYHLAARASNADQDRSAVFSANVDGTVNLLSALARQKPLPRVLLVSSGYVYGSCASGQPASEEDPLPADGGAPYTASKRAMEQAAQAFREFVVIARPFRHTGPGQSAQFAVPGWARQLAEIELGLRTEVQHGNLESEGDLLDVRDVVQAYVAIMRSAPAGQTYNVSTGSPVTMGHVLAELARLCRAPVKLEVDQSKLRSRDITCASGDPSKLVALTGWRETYNLGRTLADTLDYWRAALSATQSAADAPGHS